MDVLDDYLDQDVFLSIRASIEAASFPWERSLILKGPPAHIQPSDNLQSIHGFYLRNARARYVSQHFEAIRPIIEKLNPAHLIKAKVNLTTRKDRHIDYGLHVDTKRVGATTAIFYVNTNNGYTLFEDGSKVFSVANRMVTFDSATLHTGVSCTDADHRLVLNINMIMDPDAAQEYAQYP